MTRTNAGFTLMEILIATMIFSVTVGALYVVLHSALAMRENTHERLAMELPKRQVVSVMRKDIENIVPPKGTLCGAMLGTSDEEDVQLDSIEFFSSSGTVDSSKPWGDVEKVKYFLEESDEDSEESHLDLMREVTRNLLATIEEEPETQRLVRDVKSLTLSYYDGDNWQESWDSTTATTGLPEAVRVQLEFPSPELGERVNSDIDVIIPVMAKTTQSGESDAG